MLGLDSFIIKEVEKYSSRFYKVLRNSLKAKGEEILIVTDYGIKENVLASMMAYGYYHAAKKKGLPVNILFQGVKKGFMNADDHVVKAISKLEKENIVILALSNKLGRFTEDNSFRTFCQSRGHRFISATGLGDVNHNYLSIFLEAMNINYSRLKKKGLAIKKKWDQANSIQIKTAAGTDLTFDVSGMEAVANIGEYHQPGMGGNMPSGEVYIPPKGINNVNGQFVIDGSMKIDTGAILVNSPLTIQVRDGKVTAVEGINAHLLLNTFKTFEERAKHPERIRLIGELGIGINPGAVLIGSMILDEKVLGTGHIAIGSNNWFGGEIKTIYHGDQVCKNPVYYVDGKKMDV